MTSVTKAFVETRLVTVIGVIVTLVTAKLDTTIVELVTWVRMTSMSNTLVTVRLVTERLVQAIFVDGRGTLMTLVRVIGVSTI